MFAPPVPRSGNYRGGAPRLLRAGAGDLGGAKEFPKLKETAAALERTSTGLRPTVEQSGGATAARNTDALVVRIKAAKSPADYGSVATPFLDQVDELEKVFVKL